MVRDHDTAIAHMDTNDHRPRSPRRIAASFDLDAFRERQRERQALEYGEFLKRAEALLPSSSSSSDTGDTSTSPDERTSPRTAGPTSTSAPAATFTTSTANQTRRRRRRRKRDKNSDGEREWKTSRSGAEGNRRRERKRKNRGKRSPSRREMHRREKEGIDRNRKLKAKLIEEKGRRERGTLCASGEHQEEGKEYRTRRQLHGQPLPYYLSAPHQDKHAQALDTSFFMDTIGDADNARYQSLYRKDVPLYYRHQAHVKNHAERKMGINAGQQMPNSIGNSAVVDDKDIKTFDFAADGPSTSHEDPWYYSFSTSNYPSESTATTAERRYLEKTREFNIALQERSHEAQLWLDYAAFQEEIRNLSDADRGDVTKAIAERKISILEGALKHLPQNEKILLELLKAAEVFCVPLDLDARWKDALTICPHSLELHTGYLWWCRRGLPMLSIQDVTRRYNDAMHDVSFGLRQRLDRIDSHSMISDDEHSDDVLLQEIKFTALLLEALAFKLSSGDIEGFLSSMQSLLEFNFFSPSDDEWPQEALMEMFEEFWRSGAAMIGDRGAAGWGKWMMEDAVHAGRDGRSPQDEPKHGPVVRRSHVDALTSSRKASDREASHRDCGSGGTVGVWRDITPLFGQNDVSSDGPDKARPYPDAVGQESHEYCTETFICPRNIRNMIIEQGDVQQETLSFERDVDTTLDVNALSSWLTEERLLETACQRPRRHDPRQSASKEDREFGAFQSKVLEKRGLSEVETNMAMQSNRCVDWSEIAPFIRHRLKYERSRMELVAGCFGLLGCPGAVHWIPSSSPVAATLVRFCDIFGWSRAWISMTHRINDFNEGFEGSKGEDCGSVPWWALSARHQEFLVACAMLLVQGPMNNDTALTRALFEVASWKVPQSTEFFPASMMDDAATLKLSERATTASASKNEGLLSRDWKAGRRFAKSLLASDRENITLWCAYADLETRSSNFKVAEKVYNACFMKAESGVGGEKKQGNHQLLDLALGCSNFHLVKNLDTRCCLQKEKSTSSGDIANVMSELKELYWFDSNDGWLLNHAPGFKNVEHNDVSRSGIRTSMPIVRDLSSASQSSLESALLPLAWWITNGRCPFQRESGRSAQTLHDDSRDIHHSELSNDVVIAVRRGFQQALSAAIKDVCDDTSKSLHDVNNKHGYLAHQRASQRCQELNRIVLATAISEILMQGATGSGVGCGFVAAIAVYDQVLSAVYCDDNNEDGDASLHGAMGALPSVWTDGAIERLEAQRCMMYVQAALLGFQMEIAPKRIRSIVDRALERFPSSPMILQTKCCLENEVARNLSILRRFLNIQLDLYKDSETSILLWHIILGLEQGAGSPVGVIRATFERAVNSPMAQYNPSIWRSYIRFESSNSVRGKLKDIISRCVYRCSWSKQLWMDCMEAVIFAYRTCRNEEESRCILQKLFDAVRDQQRIVIRKDIGNLGRTRAPQ